MATVPTVSVIIPAWNGSAYLPACLDALLAQPGDPLEIIVVDNASSDGTPALVAERFPQATLVRHQHNLGFAGGCNAGLRRAAGDILVLLNQDTVVEPGWRAAILAAFTNPAIGIAGCKSLYPDGQMLQHAGGFIEWPRGFARHYGYREPDSQRWSEPRAVDFVTGAALALRRAVFERVGLLDEGFWPGYYEDIDYCFRAREAGFGVWYWPDARLVHHESTSPIQPAQVEQHLQVGRLRFVLRHLPPERFLAEFVPAERDHQQRAAGSRESLALLRGYLQVAVAARDIYCQRWPQALPSVAAVEAALLALYRHGWELDSEVMRALSEDIVPTQSPEPSSGTDGSTLRALAAVRARLRKRWREWTGRTELELRLDHHQRQLRAVNVRLQQLAEENAVLLGHLVQRPSPEPPKHRSTGGE